MNLKGVAGHLSRVAGTILLVGSSLGAQVVPDTTLKPIPAVDGLRLREGRLVYRAALHRAEGTTTPAGIRTVIIAPTLYAGGPAWSFLEQVDSVATETRDSLVVGREDLAALHWEGVRGPARIAAEIARDTMYAAASWPTGRRSIVSALGGPVLTTASALEATVSLLPLQPDWRGSARLLLLDLGGSRVVPVTIAVEGMESVQVDAGRFDCWVVTVYGDRIEDRLWVRRDAPVVVRRTQRVPQFPGAMLEQVLVSDQRR